MIKFTKIGMIGALAVTMTTSALAKDRPWWAIETGLYFFNSSEMRDEFGDSLFEFGIQPFTQRISKDWKLIFDMKVLTADSSNSRLLVIPTTASLSKSLGAENDDVIPIFKVGVGPAYYNYSILSNSVRYKESKFGWNMNASLDFIFEKRLSLGFRYDLYSKTDGFDFSGLSVNLSYALLKF